MVKTRLGLAKGNALIKRAFEALTLLVGLKLIWDGWGLLGA